MMQSLNQGRVTPKKSRFTNDFVGWCILRCVHARALKARLLAASCWASPCITALQHHSITMHHSTQPRHFMKNLPLSLSQEETHRGQASLFENWNMFSAEMKQKQEANESGPQSKVQQQLLRSIKDKSTSIHQECPTQHELIKLPCLLSSRADFDQIKSQNFRWSASFWERWREEENSATSSNWNWNKLL